MCPSACCCSDGVRHAGAQGRSGIALVPIADMLDHEPSRHVAWHAGRSGCEDFQFLTHTPVPKVLPILLVCLATWNARN